MPIILKHFPLFSSTWGQRLHDIKETAGTNPHIYYYKGLLGHAMEGVSYNTRGILCFGVATASILKLNWHLARFRHYIFLSSYKLSATNSYLQRSLAVQYCTNPEQISSNSSCSFRSGCTLIVLHCCSTCIS